MYKTVLVRRFYFTNQVRSTAKSLYSSTLANEKTIRLMYKFRVVIIGAGLSGLCLAYFLKKQGLKSIVLESRDRIGGRIHTLYDEHNPPLELGATWLGSKHNHLNKLLQELNIQTFNQELGPKAIYESISTSPPQLVTLPNNDDPSFRIKGGSLTIIKALKNQLDDEMILLHSDVIAITERGDKIEVKTKFKTITADVAVSTLPPNLLISNITFSPPLPTKILEIARKTHTWMGESIKICLTFEEPFWRKASSGTMFSNVGPVTELYDHSNFENSKYALMGFMNGGFYGASQEERKNFVLNQLSKYYGDKIFSHTAYHDCAWRNEWDTFAEYKNYILPHQNNGNPVFNDQFMKGRLLISGSETAPSHPGYMDGAVESATIAAEKIMNLKFFN